MEMNVYDKKILVIGDSHINRLRFPLRAALEKAGAASVRFNWRIGRSILGFYHKGGQRVLDAEIKHHKPDTVLIILGTNDIGNSVEVERRSFTRLRDTFQEAGVEVWAVGPPVLPRRYKTEPIVAVMHQVFGGNRFFDLRTKTHATSGRTQDRIHFTKAGAVQVVAHIRKVFGFSASRGGNDKRPKLPGAASVVGLGLLFIIDRRNKLAKEQE